MTSCEQKTYNVAVIAGFNGSSSSSLQNGLAGMNMRNVENSNRLNLMVYDLNRYQDYEVLHQNMLDSKIDFVIGPSLSSDYLKISSMLQEKGWLTFLPGATTDMASNQKDHVFRLFNSNRNQAEQYSDFVENRDIDTILLIYDNNNLGFSKAVTDYMLEFLSQRNIEAQAIAITEVDDKDNKVSILSDFKNVFIVADPIKSGLAIQKLKALGVDGDIILSNWSFSDDLLEYVGKDMDRIFVFSITYSDSEGYLNFTRNYNEEVGENPNIFSNFGYETISLIYEIDKIYKDVNIETATKFFENHSEYESLFAKYELYDTGDGQRSLTIHKLYNGVFMEVQMDE